MNELSMYHVMLQSGFLEEWKKGFLEGWKEGYREGALVAVRKLLRMWGDEQFGAPDTRTAAAIERIEDLPQLEALLLRLRIEGAKSWQELLGRPEKSRRNKRRAPP